MKNIFLNLSLSQIDERLYRKAFWWMAIAILATMAIVSADFGITWDEWIHAHFGQLILRYFFTGGQDQACLTTSGHLGGNLGLHWYGHLFDTVSTLVYGVVSGSVKNAVFQDLHWDNFYETRHAVNAVFGFVAMLFAGLLAKEIGGWRTGCLALILIAISPRFFGHSMNNPKDIPFAATYMVSIYYMVRFFKTWPKPSWKTVLLLILGIAASINVRIGGLILVAYLFLFSIFSGIIFRVSGKLNWKDMGRLASYVCLISVAGYMGGLILWPYGHVAPITNPLNALREMSNYQALILKVLYGGERIASNNLPWHYIPKWIAITSPLVVLAGWLALIPNSFVILKRVRWDHLAYVIVAAFFPILYIIFRHSPVYDGWRHVLFVYPPLVVLSAVGLSCLYDIFKNRWPKVIISVALVLLVVPPVKWMIRNHPNEYVYFNRIVGGLGGAFGYYETDYWGNCLGAAAAWLADHVKQEGIYDPVVVSSDGSVMQIAYVLKNRLENQYIPFSLSKHGVTGWDYGIGLSRQWDREELLSSDWPPEGTIGMIKADNTILCVVAENPNKR